MRKKSGNVNVNNESYPAHIPANAPQFVVDWAKNNNKDGKYTVSFINKNYYVYTHIGHKYIGSLKEDGIHESKKPQRTEKSHEDADISSPSVKASCAYQVDEYGFSRAVLELCPSDIKKAFKQEWKTCLVSMILKVSPNSYLRHLNPNISCNHYGIRFMFERKTEVSLSMIFQIMSSIFLVDLGEEKYITALNEEQKAFCLKHNINLNSECNMEATI